MRPRLIDGLILPIGLLFELLALAGARPPDPVLGWSTLICVFPLFGALLLRRRWPGPVLVVHLSWAVVTALLVDYNSVAGVLIALYGYSARSRPLWSGLALFSCLTVFAFQVMKTRDGTDAGSLVASMTLAAVAAVMAQQYGRVRRSRERAHVRADRERELAELERGKAEIERVRADREREKAELAVADALRLERLGIARELHDIVAHSVNVMMLQAAGARAVLDLDPARARDALGTVLEAGAQSMEELRRLLGLLRSAAGGELSADDPHPGLGDLQPLLDRSRAAGLAVDREIEGAPRDLDPSVSLTAYRVIQEALTNAMKHAGDDAVVRVRLEWAPDRLIITVRNHGEPPAAQTHPLSTGNGLRGLRERAVIVGGTFDAAPLPDGFRVRCELPVSRPSSRS
ncbi:sensor histidine kinase [Catenuloplanes japonicus]|uniref:sensor histidine kinase n=1 Tax=Catenuloplanes japonicus TaxID=33876 RepID=UPI0018DB2736|nr:histidine kinase [Catenuloplanes japonicus]